MPFTVSHPAAVLGLRATGLPMVGMVAGSMVPDAPMFGVVPYGYGLGHSLVGLVTVDLVAGVTAALLWLLLLADLVANAGPVWLRHRTDTSRPDRRTWLLLAPAVVVGSATHVGWDEFTHAGRWGTDHIGWLAADHLGHAGYHWAQAISSVVGLAVVMTCAVVRLRRRPPRHRPVAAGRVARTTSLGAIALSAGVGLGYAVTTLPDGLHAAAIVAVEHALATLCVGLVVAAAIWAGAARRLGRR